MTKQSVKQLLTPSQISNLTGGSASGSVIRVPADFTITLVRTVKVLSAVNPPVDTTTGRSTSGSSTFILDMTPEDAELTVFATDAATLYMGLLPPDNKDGYALPGTVGVPFAKVVGVSK